MTNPTTSPPSLWSSGRPPASPDAEWAARPWCYVGWGLWGGALATSGLSARTFHAGVDHLAFQLGPTRHRSGLHRIRQALRTAAACVMYFEVYTVDCMTDRWQIEIEPEVRDWLELLPFRLYRRVEDKTDRLLDEPTTLGEPYSRHLGG